WIGVEEHAPSRAAEYLFVGEVAHHIEQQGRILRPLNDFGKRETERATFFGIDQRKRVSEAEPVHDGQEVPQIDRLLHKAWPKTSIHAHIGSEPVEKQHVPTESAETKQILEKLPSVPGLFRLLGKGAADRDSFSHIAFVSFSRAALNTGQGLPTALV